MQYFRKGIIPLMFLYTNGCSMQFFNEYKYKWFILLISSWNK